MTFPFGGKVVVAFSVAIGLVTLSQSAAIAQKETLKGKVVDQASKSALPFASIRLFTHPDSSFVIGDVTDEEGNFSLTASSGRYVAWLEFIGYKAHRIPVDLTKGNVNLGTISLSAATQSLQEVVVQGEKSTYELSLDKRVFNVGKDLANSGGNAVEILNNVPSVAVDVEGNVSLRGSSSVRILIDGKPSGLVSLKGGSGLQSLQGSMIERIEVITNPSARYEAEGMGGIINIVLKKEQRQGINGSFDIITGNPLNLGGAANVNYRHKNFNFFTNYALSYRISPGETEQYQEVYTDQGTQISTLDNTRELKAFHNNLRMGADYFFSESSILTGAYTWRRTKGKRYSHLYFTDYLNSQTDWYSKSHRTQDETETEPNSEYNLSYKKSFGRKGHELTADVRHLNNWENSDQYFGETIRPKVGAEEYKLQRSVNDETEKQWLFQLDYIQPFGKEGKFEGGVRSSFRDMTNNYFVANQIANGSGWENIPEFTNNFLYDENIHAAYGIYGNKHSKMSYQLGLRAELSEITTTLTKTNLINNRSFNDLFPSAHVSFDVANQNALQVSYSRRIRRPGYNDLSPFMTFTDNRNYWSGNPDLNPEYTDAYELGHVKHFDKGTFTTSLYYRYTRDKIQHIRTVSNEGFAYSRPENLLKENAYGLEMTTSTNATNWLKVDGSVNFFRAQIDGSNLSDSYKSDTYSWLGRLSGRASLKGTDIQLRNTYDAPQNTPQGKRKSIYSLDLAISRDILSKNGTLTLNVLDIFNSRRYRTITQGTNFYTYNNSLPRQRQINLTFNYRLHQAKSNKKSNLEE